MAERIASEVDALAGSEVGGEPNDSPAAGAARCACGGPSREGELRIKGKSVAIAGLPLIFQHLQKKGLAPSEDCGDVLLKTVRVYHFIDAHEEADYRSALVAAYQTHCQQQPQS